MVCSVRTVGCAQTEGDSCTQIDSGSASSQARNPMNGSVCELRAQVYTRTPAHDHELHVRIACRPRAPRDAARGGTRGARGEGLSYDACRACTNSVSSVSFRSDTAQNDMPWRTQ